jgi:hypothetical protein
MRFRGTGSGLARRPAPRRHDAGGPGDEPDGDKAGPLLVGWGRHCSAVGRDAEYKPLYGASLPTWTRRHTGSASQTLPSRPLRRGLCDADRPKIHPPTCIAPLLSPRCASSFFIQRER